MQALSDETGMAITVCHYPPGTSKWNKIEHRWFSFISLNWKGKPLINFETAINLIGGTRTRTGLRVQAVLDTNQYDMGVAISDEDISQLRLKRHKVHPNWNNWNLLELHAASAGLNARRPVQRSHAARPCPKQKRRRLQH